MLNEMIDIKEKLKNYNYLAITLSILKNLKKRKLLRGGVEIDGVGSGEKGGRKYSVFGGSIRDDNSVRDSQDGLSFSS